MMLHGAYRHGMAVDIMKMLILFQTPLKTKRRWEVGICVEWYLNGNGWRFYIWLMASHGGMTNMYTNDTGVASLPIVVCWSRTTRFDLTMQSTHFIFFYTLSRGRKDLFSLPKVWTGRGRTELGPWACEQPPPSPATGSGWTLFTAGPARAPPRHLPFCLVSF